MSNEIKRRFEKWLEENGFDKPIHLSIVAFQGFLGSLDGMKLVPEEKLGTVTISKEALTVERIVSPLYEDIDKLEKRVTMLEQGQLALVKGNAKDWAKLKSELRILDERTTHLFKR